MNRPFVKTLVFRRLFSLLLLGAVILSGGCTQEEEPVYVDMSKRVDVTAPQPSPAVTYAYLPQYAHRISFQRHQPLIQYLRKATGLPIRQVFPNTFDEHVKMVGQGKIDISFSNPFIYVKLAERYGASAIARVVEAGGARNFRGQIICRADNSAVRTLEDCRGKRWIAVDPSSAGGYLFPLGLFVSHGIRPSDFAEIAFAPGPAGKQEKVVLAVYAGRFDVGSIREGTLLVVADKVDLSQIRTLAYTPWYPGWVYAVRKGLKPEVIRKIRNALVALDWKDSEHRRILEAAHFKGIVPSDDREFDPIRHLAETLRLDIRE